MAEGGGFGRSIDIGSDVLYEFSCTPCAYKNRNEEADRYCVECREHFCVSCFKQHNNFAIMRTHQILDKAGMSAQGPQQTPMVLTEKCQVHHGNTIDTYCPVHQAVGCGTCMALQHGSCKGIAYIPKVAQEFKKSKEYMDIKPAIKSSIQQLKTYKTTIQTDLDDLYKEKDVALKEIKEFRKSVEMELDRMEKKMTDEVHTKCKILQAEVTANMKSIEDMMSKLESNLENFESIKRKNDAEIFIFVKDGYSKMTESGRLLQNLNEISGVTTLQFKQNRDIDECMKKYEKLGELHEEIRKSSQVSSITKTDRTVPHKHAKLCSASLTGEYTVKMKTDTQTCHITGSTFLNDGILLIIDNHNEKVKQMNTSFQITDYCNLPGSPEDICVTGDKEVAVALPFKKEVQFVSVGKTLKLKRSFTTIGPCSGLAYTNNEIIVSNYDSTDVHIYSYKGKCLRTITVDKLVFTGRNKAYTDIALSTDHSKLTFSNNNNGVTTINIKDGNNDWVCTKQMSAARKLCVLDDDNILVADWKSNKVFKLTGDGQILVAILQEKDGSEMPLSVCVDKANTRLIVTSFENDKIQVFNLKN